MNSIRAKVVCVLWSADRMLLIRATDPQDERSFLIPPGGGVEFGELLDDAVVREIFEEVGLRIPRPHRLGMLENIFQFAGRPEHELVFVYEADCADPELCSRDEITITESNGEQLPAQWYSRADVQVTGLAVYPEGLFALLDGQG